MFVALLTRLRRIECPIARIESSISTDPAPRPGIGQELLETLRNGLEPRPIDRHDVAALCAWFDRAAFNGMTASPRQADP